MKLLERRKPTKYTNTPERKVICINSITGYLEINGQNTQISTQILKAHDPLPKMFAKEDPAFGHIYEGINVVWPGNGGHKSFAKFWSPSTFKAFCLHIQIVLLQIVAIYVPIKILIRMMIRFAITPTPQLCNGKANKAKRQLCNFASR